MAKPEPTQLSEYPHHLQIPTRWNDNDPYGHVNNAVYYFFFDTVVNNWLIGNGLLEIGKSPVVGLVVETGCSYFAPVSYPEIVTAGLRVRRVGTSSVQYEIGIFRKGETFASAQGRFVHVYVSDKDRKPVPLSQPMIEKLRELQHG